MQNLTRHLLAGMIMGSVALAGAVLADDHQMKHKVIEIKALKDQPISVEVDSDGQSQVIVLSSEELADEQLLEDKLAELDEQTRETVLNAIKNSHRMLQGNTWYHEGEGNHEQVIIMNKGDGEVIRHNIHGIHDVDVEIEGESHIERKIVIKGTDGILTGHTDAIVSMIERGQFSQEELDKIQAAVDAKR